jgi:CRISPR/Cas system-associated exonuclease Cas4 (RecB family)
MSIVHLPMITVSEVKCFHRCQREHLISYRYGVRSIRRAGALHFGSGIHAGLEAWWNAAKGGLPREEWLFLALAAVSMALEDPFDVVRAGELLRGYHARWADQSLDVLGVEVEFAMPLVNPATDAPSKTFRVGGKIDALARTKDGTVYVIEHKSSSEDIGGGSDYWRRLRLDAQVSTYFAGARSLGHDVAGCIYDVIGKVKLQPYEPTPIESRKFKKDGTLYANQRIDAETVDEYRARVREHIAASPDRYFVRGIVARTEEDERDAAFDMWQTARAMADAERMQRFPRNDQACVRWGRTCEYFGVCTREASLDDETKFRRAAKPHEELDGGAQTDAA